MKNKRLIIILSIFAFITLLIILGSAVFTLNKAEVKWLTTTSHYSGADNKGIIDSAGFNYRESIFLVNKKKYAEKLEKENPYLRVVGIVTEFPNKLIVNVAEREELYALKVKDGKNENQNSYLILDKQLKILSIRNSFGGSANEPVLLETNILQNDNDFNVGEFANHLLINNVLVNLGDVLERLNFNAPKAKNDIKSIYINLNAHRSEVSIMTRWGIKIIIEDPNVRMFEKAHKAFSVYLLKREEGESRGELKAFIHEDTVKVVYSLTGDFS